jgi:site-specific recombinase XerD
MGMELMVVTEPRETRLIADLALDSLVVLDSLDSPASRIAYRRSLRDFLLWYRNSGQMVINKATVQRYAADLREQGKSAQNINQRLSAIRKLASEAADMGHIPQDIATGIKNVRGIRAEGIRCGNWLTKQQAQDLLDSPDTTTLKGSRDKAILAVLLGCGLRRNEAAHLTFEHVQMRENRWVICDLKGKRNRTRSIPMPAWTKNAIDQWASRAQISTGRVFRPMNRGGKLTGESLTDQPVADVVTIYAPKGIAPHDLRRTFAKLAFKGSAGLDQIQMSLGHSSIQTTERYLGVQQNLTDAPCDHLGLKG